MSSAEPGPYIPLCGAVGKENFNVCSQYPVRKLIVVGDKVVPIFLYKSPPNAPPPTS